MTYELIDVRCACEDDGSSIVDRQNFVLAAHRNFAEIEVHHAIPKRAHGLTCTDVLKEVHQHQKYADALPRERIT